VVRLAQLALTLALLTGHVYAGEKINLICSGLVKEYTRSSKWTEYGPTRLIVDLDANEVTWEIESFSITENKGSLISFEGGRGRRAPAR
jgi:hypothetical protein